MTHLSPKISHLVSARPISVTMGNAIRQFKLEISGSDIDMPEQDARVILSVTFLMFKKLVLKGQGPAMPENRQLHSGSHHHCRQSHSRSCEQKDWQGWRRDSHLCKIIDSRKGLVERGKLFSVIVVDSRPLLEGKALLQALTSAPLVSWTQLSNDRLRLQFPVSCSMGSGRMK
ncbi:hypothetical protein C8R45DRAFT_375983 [Mycena sanguinolenta]|nr:hypothetical protein C8R45DRAFT_375983 [Mycena sanguinolenta]